MTSAIGYNAMNYSIAGLNNASAQVDNIASDVASGGGDLTNDAVGMITADTDFQANIAMLKQEQQMSQALVHMVDKLV